jgi:hypothetical protein
MPRLFSYMSIFLTGSIEKNRSSLWTERAMIGVRCDVLNSKGISRMADGSFAQKRDADLQAAESLDVAIDSPVIRRLIDEVRAEEVSVPRSYNRTFNRHNR